MRSYFASRSQSAGASRSFTVESEIVRLYGGTDGLNRHIDGIVSARKQLGRDSTREEVEKEVRSNLETRVRVSNDVTDYLKKERNVVIDNFTNRIAPSLPDRIKSGWPLSRYMKVVQSNYIEYALAPPRSWQSRKGIDEAMAKIDKNLMNYERRQEYRRRYGD